MGLTLAGIRGSIVRNLGGDSNTEYDVSLDNEDLTAIINESNHAIEAEKDWPWLATTETITTVAGTYLYTPTAGWYRTKDIFLPDNWALEVVGETDLDERWPMAGDRGQPQYFAERAGQLDIRPIPDGVYSLKHTYFRTEPELIDDSDEPLLPAQFRGRLVDSATATAAARHTNWAVAQYHLAKDAQWRKRMEDDLRRTKRTPGVRIRRDSAWARI